MAWLKSTIIHVISVVVALGVAYFLVKVLNVDNTTLSAVIALVVLALEKLVRTHPSIPVKDYVNG